MEEEMRNSRHFAAAFPKKVGGHAAEEKSLTSPFMEPHARFLWKFNTKQH